MKQAAGCASDRLWREDNSIPGVKFVLTIKAKESCAIFALVRDNWSLMIRNVIDS